jgi:hypothetical protein
LAKHNAIKNPTKVEPKKTTKEVRKDIKKGRIPTSVCPYNPIKKRNKIIATASFKALSPKIKMYNRLSTFIGNKLKTVTGSVEEIKDPKTKHSINVHPTVAKSLEKIYIKIEIEKVDQKPPTMANPRIGIIFWKNIRRCIENPPSKMIGGSNTNEKNSAFNCMFLFSGS